MAQVIARSAIPFKRYVEQSPGLISTCSILQQYINLPLYIRTIAQSRMTDNRPRIVEHVYHTHSLFKCSRRLAERRMKLPTTMAVHRNQQTVVNGGQKIQPPGIVVSLGHLVHRFVTRSETTTSNNSNHLDTPLLLWLRSRSRLDRFLRRLVALHIGLGRSLQHSSRAGYGDG
jgi:hypothetical protein